MVILKLQFSPQATTPQKTTTCTLISLLVRVLYIYEGPDRCSALCNFFFFWHLWSSGRIQHYKYLKLLVRWHVTDDTPHKIRAAKVISLGFITKQINVRSVLRLKWNFSIWLATKGIFDSSSMSQGAFAFESIVNVKEREQIINKKNKLCNLKLFSVEFAVKK